MSEARTLLIAMAERLFADIAQNPFDVQQRKIDESGLALLLVPEAKGGFGGSWHDAYFLFRLAGFHALDFPLCELIIAQFCCGQTSDTLIMPALHCDGKADGTRFSGTLTVPYGHQPDYIIGYNETDIVMLAAGDGKIARKKNIAGEPRDIISFQTAHYTKLPKPPFPLSDMLCLARCAQIAGALDAALALSVDYVNQREQFGRPLAKFQAVQQSLAEFALEAAAANNAAMAAFQAAETGTLDFAVGAAKLRANMAAGEGARIAHQVHGAMGFTQDYALHPLSKRLWAWRAECGTDAVWEHHLGTQICTTLSADTMWDFIVRQ